MPSRLRTPDFYSDVHNISLNYLICEQDREVYVIMSVIYPMIRVNEEFIRAGEPSEAIH
jgi:hypothetical protein